MELKRSRYFFSFASRAVMRCHVSPKSAPRLANSSPALNSLAGQPSIPTPPALVAVFPAFLDGDTREGLRADSTTPGALNRSNSSGLVIAVSSAEGSACDTGPFMASLRTVKKRSCSRHQPRRTPRIGAGRGNQLCIPVDAAPFYALACEALVWSGQCLDKFRVLRFGALTFSITGTPADSDVPLCDAKCRKRITFTRGASRYWISKPNGKARTHPRTTYGRPHEEAAAPFARRLRRNERMPQMP